MNRLQWLRALLPATCAGLLFLAAGPVGVALGSKNFSPPGYVPNYFSNEAGSFRGAAPATAQPGGGVIAAPPVPGPALAVARAPSRQHARRAKGGHGRFALVRGKKASRRPAAHAHAHVHAGKIGRPVHPTLAHAVAAKHAGGKALAAKGRPAPPKTKRLARAHG